MDNAKIFTVLMVVSETDNENFLERALKSITIDQTFLANEYVIIRNGHLSSKKKMLIDTYMQYSKVKYIDNEKMESLAASLNLGLHESSNELIARMDPDDISLPERFEMQFLTMKNQKEVSVCGTFGEEFNENKKTSFIKTLPTSHKEIYKFAKWRCPIIHPSVMFRKSDVIDVGGYPEVNRSQDYLLWTKMLKRGYQFMNIKDVYIKVRSDEDLARRRGFDYYKSELDIFKRMYQDKFISFPVCFANLFLRFFIRLSPPTIRLFFYKLRPGNKL